LTDNNGNKLNKNDFILYSRHHLDVTDNISDVLQLLKDINYMFSNTAIEETSVAHALSRTFRRNLKNRLLNLLGIDIDVTLMNYLTSSMTFIF
jgi:hypothetical protein